MPSSELPSLGIVTPYLVVAHGRALLEFVKRAFDASEVECHLRADGSLQHAEVRIGASVIMMGETQLAGAPRPGTLHVRARDVDAVYGRAIAAGATSLREPTDQANVGRMAAVADPEGNHWYFASS